MSAQGNAKAIIRSEHASQLVFDQLELVLQSMRASLWVRPVIGIALALSYTPRDCLAQAGHLACPGDCRQRPLGFDGSQLPNQIGLRCALGNAMATALLPLVYSLRPCLDIPGLLPVEARKHRQSLHDHFDAGLFGKRHHSPPRGLPAACADRFHDHRIWLRRRGVLQWHPGHQTFALVVIVYLALLFSILRQVHAAATNTLLLRYENSDLLAEQGRLICELAGARQVAEQKCLEAEKANQSKSQFLANMSHELRTPLERDPRFFRDYQGTNSWR